MPLLNNQMERVAIKPGIRDEVENYLEAFHLTPQEFADIAFDCFLRNAELILPMAQGILQSSDQRRQNYMREHGKETLNAASTRR